MRERRAWKSLRWWTCCSFRLWHNSRYIVPIRIAHQRSQLRDPSGVECGSSTDQVNCHNPRTNSILSNAVIVNLSCPLRLADRPDFVRYHLRMLRAREKSAFAWSWAFMTCQTRPSQSEKD